MWTTETLTKLDLRPFAPPRILDGPLRQTLVPYYLPFKEKAPPGKHQKIKLPDGDQLVVKIDKPLVWQAGDRVVVMIHGLAGSEDSPYLIRIGRKLFDLGYAVVKMNLRSCGPGRGFSKKPYHSGQSEDTRELLHWLAINFPSSPVTQVGFSLSANITLKMLGEENEYPLANLDSAIAVSPPMDLLGTAFKITELSFKMFDHFFMLKLKQFHSELSRDFPDLGPNSFPKAKNLIDFDNQFTAPRSGFTSAYDYYLKASSRHYIDKINKRALILHSTDDPVVESNVLGQIKVPEVIDVLEFTKGGHVGFIDAKGYWLDEALIRWIQHL